ncbi:MAG: ParB/RepB/Spo0J family partition protein [Ruminococcaceae bacterium]|nr:ParB/RepB/Spo0J family partition protein [Oscillospiraceae bacterium]
MAKRGGLGSGLGAIFGDEYVQSPVSTAAEAEQNTDTLLPITKVEPRKDQPRYHFDEDALAELTDSIREYGLIQPITVREIDSGYYQIIAGERRWRAARAAGLTEVPVRIIEADDKRAMELALVENLQREDLNPIEEARGYRTLMEEYGLTQEETSAAVGKSRPAVANALRLLSLSAPVLAMVECGKLSAGHARAITSLSGEALQLEAAQAVLDRHLSVRQAEALAARLSKAAPAEETPADSQRVVVDYVREVERELENALGRKVKLVDGKKKGRLEIEFYGAEDREKLIENLKLFSSLRRNK